MRKLVLALAALVMATPAMADPYRYHRAPPRPQRHHGINPWVAGAIGLGILGGGAYYYNNYGRRCWNEAIIDRFGYPVYDEYGRQMVRRICD